jgi:hypothetical protein
MRVARQPRSWPWLLLAAAAASGAYEAVAAANRVSDSDVAALEHERAPAPSVILITLDGVRWQEIFHGVDARLARQHGLALSEVRSAASLTPNLHRLAAHHGAMLGAGARNGAQVVVRASGPNFVSLPGYMELLTGKRSNACTSNDCEAVTTPTLLDELAAQTDGHSLVLSSWPVVGRASSLHHRGVLGSFGRSEGEQRAELAKRPGVAEAFDAGVRDRSHLGDDGYRPDVHTANAALAYWRSEVPRLSFISLGDTDEYAHADDYRAYLAALQRADAFVGRAMELVLQRVAAGRPTTLLVTTDHGRADSFTNHGARYPESARIWLAAMGSGIGARGNVVLTRSRHLADIAPTLRLLLGLSPQRGPDQGRALRELRLRAPDSVQMKSAIALHARR